MLLLCDLLTISGISFKVTAEMVEPFLDGMTLEDAMKNKKIYIVNLKKLSDVMCRFNRVVSKFWKLTGSYCCCCCEVEGVSLIKCFWQESIVTDSHRSTKLF